MGAGSQLTFLAAPRASTERTTELLEELSSEFNGASFWVLLEDERLVCLNSVVANSSLDPGFNAGDVCTFAETRIPYALTAREQTFVVEPDETRTTILIPIISARGHDLGWVGLSLLTTQNLPPARSIRARTKTKVAP